MVVLQKNILATISCVLAIRPASIYWVHRNFLRHYTRGRPSRPRNNGMALTSRLAPAGREPLWRERRVQLMGALWHYLYAYIYLGSLPVC